MSKITILGIIYGYFSPDGKKIATISIDSTTKLWDVINGTLIYDLKDNDEIYGACFSPDGQKYFDETRK